VDGVTDPTDETAIYELSDLGFELTCPECGNIAEGTVSLGAGRRLFCECGHNWAPSEIENCIECGKPLGGTDVVCYTCRELGGGGA